jgi:hypothetical protein
MEIKTAPPSAIAIKGRITGLWMMTMFTLFWASIAYNGLAGSSYRWLLIIFALACIAFIYNAFLLLKLVHSLPKVPETISDADKKKRKLFLYVLAGEGIGIFLAINIVIKLNHPELQIPALALIVGLHFFPLGKVFNRKADYYLATWSTLIAILAIVFTLNHTFTQLDMLVFTGVGLAIATVSYGILMILGARPLFK